MVGRFSSLLRADVGLAPGEQQRLAYERFPSTVANSPMSLWRQGETIPTNGTRILIGVATYSIQDLSLLDSIESKLSIKTGRQETTQLFDVLKCTDMDDFEEYVSGIGKVFQTPVLGVWESGILQYKAAGWSARKWLSVHYELTSV